MGQLGKYYKYSNDIYATQKVFIDEVVPNLLNYSCTTEPFNVMNNVRIASYKNTGQFQSRALAGVSMAIYEVHAKRQNQSVGDYLGGDTTKPIPIYGSSVTRSKTAEQVGKEFQALIQDWGIHQFKFKIAQVRNIRMCAHLYKLVPFYICRGWATTRTCGRTGRRR